MLRSLKAFGALLVLCAVWCNYSLAQNQPTAATIKVNLDKEVGAMYPMWAWFGYDEPNYTYMKDGRKLLSEISALSPVPVHVRAHSMLVTGDGIPKLKWGSTNAYTEDANGKPIYNWRLVDSIFDTYVKRGMKPFAQIGFMPEAMSTKPDPYKHSWTPGGKSSIATGWAYPPKDYNKWAELVYQWVKHSVDRYGKTEVESWYWELWNEPNIEYWKGTPEEFFKLYDYTVDAVKRALPTAKIGGADVAGTGGRGGTKFLTDFLTHCVSGTNYVTGKVGTPIDLISFHAKGAPTLVDGVVRMNVGTQMRDIQKGFNIVASFPTLKNLPIIIGESDPEGCAACGMVTSPQNAYRNGTMYPSYTAASFARKYQLADEIGINFKGAVTWAFEFEDQPWFYGFRDLATNGVDKPVLNVFRMFGKMAGKRVEVIGSRMYPLRTFVDSSARGQQTDIGGLAAKDAKAATVMVWNYHDLDIHAAPEPVAVSITGLKATSVTLTQYLVDATHSNSYEAWKKMGSPQNPTKEQIATLEKAGMLESVGKPQKLSVKNGNLTINTSLARQGVALLKLDW